VQQLQGVTDQEQRRRVIVGAFVIGAGALLLVAIVLLGRTQSLFKHKTLLHAWFQNTSGLVVGAPVRLAGVDVGVVESIQFSPDVKVKKVHVALGVESRYLDRIREDSVARLGSKGLLGDTIVDITVGSVEARPLATGATLRAAESEGLNEVVASVEEAMNELRGAAQSVDARVRATFTDELAADVHRVARSTANTLEGVERGPGLAHALIFEPRFKNRVGGLIDDTRAVVASANRATTSVERLLAQAEHGPGTLHGLLYRDDGAKLLADADHAVGELTAMLGEIEHGRGLAHTLIYEERDRRNLIENLTELSRTLRRLGDEVDQGKGTVGGLLKDPSVYEDLKVVFGNVKRNKMLRWLVRYSIRKDGLSAR
jgi:phospholipid/cholesterol/gamma-HCH transport system substrate-binding protein